MTRRGACSGRGGRRKSDGENRNRSRITIRAAKKKDLHSGKALIAQKSFRF